jgi:hypothetical protein
MLFNLGKYFDIFHIFVILRRKSLIRRRHMKIEATSRTPLIEINSGYCLIKGECYPEDISEISIPIMKEIEQELLSVEKFVLELELYYFNSSSAKLLFDIFDKVDEAAADGLDVQIKWNYRSGDDSMQEAGEDFEEDIKNSTFKMQEI